jgi:hypothetical protein
MSIKSCAPDRATSAVHRFIFRVISTVIAPLLFFFMISCGSGTEVTTAKQSVDLFHSQVDSEQYDAVYAAADDGMHKAATAADFVNLLTAIHTKLGSIQASQFQNYRVNLSTGEGATVTLVYNTTFQRGDGAEEFLWHMRDGKALLLGYHITSNALITK